MGVVHYIGTILRVEVGQFSMPIYTPSSPQLKIRISTLYRNIHFQNKNLVFNRESVLVQPVR